MSKLCKPGGSVGDPNDTQISCPEPSEYYRELKRYKIASGFEKSMADQDADIGATMSKASDLQMRAKDLLGDKKADMGVKSSSINREFEIDRKLADAQKYANAAEESLRTNYAARQESEALKEAIKHNRKLASMIYMNNQSRDKRAIQDKSRIISVNNEAFYQKKELIHRLTYIIYFIIYSIGLGIAVVSGVISMRVVGVALVVGMIGLTVYAIRSTSAVKTYGDVSMGVAKGVTRDFIKAVAPQKTCPKRCTIKSKSKEKADKKKRWEETCDYKTDPNCPRTSSPVMPYDWKVDDPTEASNFFSKGEFGEHPDSSGSVSKKPFACRWTGDPLTRPSYEKEIIHTHVPCNYIENRDYA